MKHKIINCINSFEYQELKRLFSRVSFFTAVNSARNENIHSNFLSWLLKNEQALRKFLQALTVVPKELNPLNDIRFSAGNYRLSNIKVTREKSIDTSGRIDIYIDFFVDDNPYVIIIENKVYSKEQNNQTQKYSDWLDINLPGGTTKIMVYLTPLPKNAYEQLKSVECCCKKFTQINYQSIVDNCIEPFARLCDGNIKSYIDEYLVCLSTPENGDKIMAYSENEKELLKAFWNNHKDLLIPALTAIVDTSDDVTDDVKASIEIVKNAALKWRWSKAQSGGSKLSMSKVVKEIIEHYIKENNIKSFETLLKAFPDNVQYGAFGVIKNGNDNLNKAHYLKDYILLENGGTVAVCNQWCYSAPKNKSFNKFISHTEKLGYKINIDIE